MPVEEIEISELEEFEPTRVDGVGKGANGFPVLMLKSIGEICDACNGESGHCAKCRGTGLMPQIGMTAKELAEAAKEKGVAPSGAPVPVRHDCPTCNGSGVIEDAENVDGQQCPDCGGSGRDGQYNEGHVEDASREARDTKGEFSVAHADEGKITVGAGGRETIDKSTDDGCGCCDDCDDDCDGDCCSKCTMGAEKSVEACDDEECDVCKEVLAKKKLSYKDRKKLSSSAFVFPKERRYPIHDEAHARNALARVSQFGTPEEKAKVRAAVRRRYPNIEVSADAEKSEGSDVVVKDGVVSGTNPFLAKPDDGDDIDTGPAPGSPEWEAVDAATATAAAEALMEAAEHIRTFAQREAVEVAAGEGNDVFDTYVAESALCGVSQALGVMAQMAFHEGRAAAMKSTDSEVAQKAGKRLSSKTVGALTALRDHVNNLLGDDDPANGTVDHDNDDVAAKSILSKEIDDMTGEELIKLLDERDEARRAAEAEKVEKVTATADPAADEAASTAAAHSENSKGKSRKKGATADDDALETEAAQGTNESASGTRDATGGAKSTDDTEGEDAKKAEPTPEEIAAKEERKAAAKALKKAKKAEKAAKAQAAQNAAVAKELEESKTKAEEAVKALEERLATVEKMAAPSTIVRTPPAEATAKSAERDALELEISRFETLAKTTSEPDLRRGYSERAKELRVQLAEKEGKA